MKLHQHIQHLYWRAGFGLSPTEWEERKSWSVQMAVNELFDKAKQIKQIKGEAPKIEGRPNQMDQAARQKFVKDRNQSLLKTNVQWIERMADPNESALLERMTFFWHGHFACDPKSGTFAAQQINSIRKHALGNFKDLVLAIARDPAMIRYLNNQQNRKDSPNENFARELMELFTIGRGNYTEQDVKEAARAFTGWSSGIQGQFIFRRFQHDYESKTFMGKTGNFDGDDIVDIILKRKETAHFITAKIYKYFINEDADEDRIQKLANQFYRSNYNIGLMMRTIFTSPWFYEPKHIGTRIKSPIDFLVGIKKQLNVELANELQLVGVQRALGQILFKPPNVAGWPGGKNWIDNSTLMMRLNLSQGLYGASDLQFRLKADLENEQRQNLRKLTATIDFSPIQKLVKDKNQAGQHQTLSHYLLSTKQIPKAADIIKYTDRRSPEAFTKTLAIRIMSLPEYQMC